MAKFKIESATAKGKTWKAVGTNPITGKKMTFHGGQEGTPVGSKNPQSERSFDARHDATGMTPKKYVNKLRWDDKAKIGSTINIPGKLFKAKKNSLYLQSIPTKSRQFLRPTRNSRYTERPV